MDLNTVKRISCKAGDEAEVMEIIQHSKFPLIIHLENFPSHFDTHYLRNKHPKSKITFYSLFKDNQWIKDGQDYFVNIIDKINKNESYRIFAEHMNQEVSEQVIQYLPILNLIPKRTKYLLPFNKIPFFIGGAGGSTSLHYDREYVNLLHLCLSGEKRFYLFLEDQSPYLYKTPFFGDSSIWFQEPITELIEKYPKLKESICYLADLSCGDLLYMPRNCWHYTMYKSPSVSTCFSLYPTMFEHLIGGYTGCFYYGYNIFSRISQNALLKRFAKSYSFASGFKKYLLKGLEIPLYCLLSPPIATYAAYKLKTKYHRF